MNVLFPTLRSLRNMIAEMNRKNLDLKRITKTSALLICGGLSANSIPSAIIRRCLEEQHEDGGWVSIVDTMWNSYFLNLFSPRCHSVAVRRAKDFLLEQVNPNGLWGRSKRDISRIPVTGMLLYLFPDMAGEETLVLLEELWQSEKNSLTYKAAYTLMAFKAADYSPHDETLVEQTLEWLLENQRPDGSFGPWKSHPAASDVFCTSVALLGLTQYPETIPPRVFKSGYKWLLDTRLPSGIWPYHEIEDGASWAFYVLSLLLKHNLVSNG